MFLSYWPVDETLRKAIPAESRVAGKPGSCARQELDWDKNYFWNAVRSAPGKNHVSIPDARRRRVDPDAGQGGYVELFGGVINELVWIICWESPGVHLEVWIPRWNCGFPCALGAKQTQGSPGRAGRLRLDLESGSSRDAASS
jgi:hypothetical protein